MEIVDIFMDKRIQLVQHPDWLGIEATIWKAKTYVDRAYDLHRSTNIDEDNRHKLFQVFDNLIYKTGLPWEKIKTPYKRIIEKDGKIQVEDFYLEFQQKDINNIHRMMQKFQEFDLDSDDLKKLDKIKEKVESFKKKKGWS